MSAEEFANKSYDYIICGGGTAGLVIAARLTEDPNVTVGVIEAGGSGLNDIMIDGPNLFTQLYGKPQYDWIYSTTPQEGTLGRKHGWVRGKILGGSSAVNFNMFSMASKQDLDNWAELGNKGWSFDDMRAYYRKFETYNPSGKEFGDKINNKYLDPSLRGTDGPIQISFTETDLAWIQDVWPKTMLNAGYAETKDPRTGSAIGGFNQLTTVHPTLKRRSYAAREYYEPNAGRSNLSLVLNALVSKIDLEKTGGDAKATGVQFVVDGKTHTVKCKKEVIVCGGSINSPQILELSGIGSPEVLQKAGVETLVENHGVGANLNDHTATALVLGVKDEYPTAEAMTRNPEIAQQAFEAYANHQAGPLSAAPTSTGFTSLEKVQPNFSDAKDHIQSLVADYAKKNPDNSGRDELLARQLLDPKEAVAQVVCLPTGADVRKCDRAGELFTIDEPGFWCVLGVCSTRSLSRGSVHINSSDPTKQPDIDPAYYKHPLDVDMMARAMTHVATLAEVEPLKSVLRRNEDGTPIVAENQGGHIPQTLEEMKDFVRANTVTEYHPIGTCAMLPKEKGGAVDAQLRLYGTSNIRVADASIFPLHVQGNIVSLVYALAEKAADLIKGKNSGATNGTNGVNGH